MTQLEKYDALISRLFTLGFKEDTVFKGQFEYDDIAVYLDKHRILSYKGIVSLDSIYDIAQKSETPGQFKLGLDRLIVEQTLDEHEKRAAYQAERTLSIRRFIDAGYIDVYGDGICLKKNDIIITFGSMSKCMVVTGKDGTHLISYGINTDHVEYRYRLDNWDRIIDLLCAVSNMTELENKCQEY